jgi:GTP-binding protein
MSLPVVAIVGRPNVGKSTLFNRIVGFKKLVVHDRPGVTRDRLYEEAEALGRRFLAIDTGGIEPDPETELLSGMRRQVLVAVEEADVIVFLVDGRAGFTNADMEVADLLRRSGKPIVLAINKIDGHKHEELTADFWRVGIQPMLSVSAEHGRGVYELLEAVIARLPAAGPGEVEEDEGFAAQEQADFDAEALAAGEVPDPPSEPPAADIRIAVIGRPNIGKSTLINKLLGEERHVVDDAPGTTTDPVDSVLEVDGQRYVLVDTAGVRKKARIEDDLERFVSLRSIQAIERCHLCLLMIDGTVGITDQDAKLAQLVADRGRGLILLFNKWDLVKGLEDVDANSIEDEKEQKLPHAPWAPHLFISARTGKGLHRVLPSVNEVYAQFNRHIGTPEVNRFLERTVATHTVPQRYHKPVRLYYAAQTRIRPPTFVFFSNTPEGVIPQYKAFLARRLREEYGFGGSPLRLHFRKRRKLGEAPETGTTR